MRPYCKSNAAQSTHTEITAGAALRGRQSNRIFKAWLQTCQGIIVCVCVCVCFTECVEVRWGTEEEQTQTKIQAQSAHVMERPISLHDHIYRCPLPLSAMPPNCTQIQKD